jgi:hypothetical protein
MSVGRCSSSGRFSGVSLPVGRESQMPGNPVVRS